MQSFLLTPPSLVGPPTHDDVYVTDDAVVQPVGFEASTPIKTPNGMAHVGALSVGDYVTTRDGGQARVVSVDCTELTAEDLHRHPDDAPIRFDPAALPGMCEATAILMSSDLPVYLPPRATAGEDTDYCQPRITHFPAKAFCDGGLIRRVIPDEGVRYINLHLDGDHQICAAGIWVGADASCPHATPTHLPSQWHVAEFRPIR